MYEQNNFMASDLYSLLFKIKLTSVGAKEGRESDTRGGYAGIISRNKKPIAIFSRIMLTIVDNCAV